jgi:16S rRNA C967 or C1407 C5-methylase (RsmB/RsmF family)/NOL1/NOP2/fmu family ribosome biogenesis protein
LDSPKQVRADLSFLLPADFRASVEHLINDWPAFEQALAAPPSLSVRIHPTKFKSTPNLEKVPWCPHGFYLNERPVFSFDPAFHGGAYYVQEAGSMLLWHVFDSLFPENRELKVLDLCAAPGGKSTLILSWLNNRGFLVANEVIGKRARILEENLNKWGYSNRLVTNSDPEKFEKIGELFDVIVVDAPCSGEGMFRKEEDAVSMWSLENVQHCHLRQNRILEQAMACLKPGGYLIYSTCTYNETENEGSVRGILKQFNASSVDLNLPENFNINRSERDGIIGYRCFPHKVRSEGFFTGVLRKPESDLKPYSTGKKNDKKLKDSDSLAPVIAPWLADSKRFSFLEHRGEIIFFPKEYADFSMRLTSDLHVLSLGTKAGKVIRNELIPDHSLALSVDLNPSAIPTLEMDDAQVLAYLKKDSFAVDAAFQGLTLCCYHGIACGWGKVISGRMKNAYPVNLRIQHSNPVIQSLF